MKTKNLTKPIFTIALLLGALCWGGCGECPPSERNKPFPPKEEFNPSERRLCPYKDIDSVVLILTEVKNKQTEITKYKLTKTKTDSFYSCNRHGEPCGNCMSSGVKFVNYHYYDNESKYGIIIRQTAAKEEGFSSSTFFTSSLQLIFEYANLGYDSLFVPNSTIFDKYGSEKSFPVYCRFSNGGEAKIWYSFASGFLKGSFENQNKGTWELQVLD